MKKLGLGLVTARSGSKGYPNKNIAMLNGRPLLEYAFRAGNSSTYLDATYISTDSSDYEAIAKRAGGKSLGLRNSTLAGDRSLSIDVVCDFVGRLNYLGITPEYIVLLQPTSPVRSGKQIDECIALHLDSGESVISVSKVDEPHPYKLKKIDDDGRIVPFIENCRSDLPRQTLPEAFQLTGAIYVASTRQLMEERNFFSSSTIPYVTEQFANIDTRLDFDFLEYKLHKGVLTLP